MKKLIVHMIGNAHLDPVWLWTWPAGVDEALATCRTACDLLDEYPDLYITRGEAWVYYQVQKLEPKLFARILRHVKSGRWQIVNGWWVQSDCNFPTEESFMKQAEIGKRYFRRNLGVNVTIGYNVDSFGHCAMLPRFLHKSGMDCYIFQRPAAHEKALPGNLFTWKAPCLSGRDSLSSRGAKRSGAPGSAITTFRLSPTYTSETIEGTEKNLVHSIETANRDVGHTMCFYGVGDHGGGPTREQIDWIRNHINYKPDVELRLSHPKAFFDAVKRANVKLPEVKGELQYHAVGCYSVVHQVKQEMRKAENILIQAEQLAKKHGFYQSETRKELDKAWEKVLFNQFHDIMGGSSVATAYEHSRDELGFAKAIAREAIVDITRRLIGKIKPKAHQQIVLANASKHPYKGLIEFEPWLPAHATKSPITLIGSNGKQIPYQKLAPEAAVSFFVKRLLFPVQIPAMGHKTIQIHYKEPRQPKSTLNAGNQIISNEIISARLAKSGIKGLYLSNNEKSLIGKNGINITAFDDKSDTWSHGISHYIGKPIGMFKSATPWQTSEKGPLRIALFNTFNLGSSNILWQIFIQPDEPLARFRLRVRWGTKQQILKLVIPCGFKPIERWDGCPGGEIRRPIDGQEYPMHNFIVLKGIKSSLAVISPDAYGVDVLNNNTIRITLLRSPYYAHHAPFPMPQKNIYPVTDSGIHEYEFSIMALPRFGLKPIHDEINRLSKPIWIGETTRGMSPI